MFKVGGQVKIEDIGELATCMKISGRRLRLKFGDDTFWIDRKYCRAV